MSDLEKAKTNYELAIQIFANNPTDENANFYRLQQKIYDHVNYGKMTLDKANKTEKQYYQADNFNNVIAIYKKP
jgi:hypothetical protein